MADVIFGEGGTPDHPRPLPFIRENNARTHGSPFAATVKRLREAQLFSLRKFNLQSIWPHKVRSKGVREPAFPVITVTNPGRLAAIDPIGKWGELAGGWATWPLSPPLCLLCGDRLCLYKPRGGRYQNSKDLHTTGTKRLLAQLIKVQRLGNWGAPAQRSNCGHYCHPCTLQIRAAGVLRNKVA